MRSTSTARAVITVVLALTIHAVGGGQEHADYRALVTAYLGDDPVSTVSTLATWPESRVRPAVSTFTKEHPNAAWSMAAAMLHTEAAFLVDDRRRAVFHVDTARAWLAALKDDQNRLFVSRWHGLVATLYAMRAEDTRARQEIQLGLAVDAKNKDVQLVAGVLDELAFRRSEPNPRGRWNTDVRLGVAKLDARLQNATSSYHRLLSEYPDNLEARLRLGWVNYLNNSSGSAREQLGRVNADAARPELRYLARLFLGAVEEGDGHLDDAARQYGAALEICACESTFIALIRIETARNHDDRARRLAATFAARPVMPDPWTDYQAGLTGGELLEWLRRETRGR